MSGQKIKRRQCVQALTRAYRLRAATIPAELPSAGDAQPLVFDATGDMKVDLLGQPWASSSDVSTPFSGLKLWRNELGGPNGSFTL